MSSQLSAQAITAQIATTRMSIRRCSILPWQRGSSTTPRCRTRLSMDMILSSQPRGHVIIHQARASDRNFMRLPWSAIVSGHLFKAQHAAVLAEVRGLEPVLEALECLSEQAASRRMISFDEGCRSREEIVRRRRDPSIPLDQLQQVQQMGLKVVQPGLRMA